MVSFNLEGFRRNKSYLHDLLNHLCPKVVFLQEVWLPYHDQSQLNDYLPDYSFKIATPDMFQLNEDKLLNSGPTWHGVAIGWHQEINSNISFPETNHERVVGIKLQKSGNSLLMISFYAPTSGHDDDFLESISFLTSYIHEHSRTGDNVVIGTDCNCSEKSTLRRQVAWKNFCETFSLKMYKTGSPTFHHNNGTSESSIDIFAASNTLEITNVHQICTLETPSNLSSHDPIAATIVVQDVSEIRESKHKSSYKAFHPEKIVWDESRMDDYQKLAGQALSDAQEYWDTPETIPLLSSLFSKLLVQCAEMVFDKKPTKTTTTVKSSKRVLQAEKTLLSSFKKWKRGGRPASKTDPLKKIYTTAKSNLQRLRRHEDNLKSIKHNNFLMNSYQHNRNKVYAHMKKVRGGSSSTKTSFLQTPVGTYHGEDVLEGFAADAEHLGKPNDNSSQYDHSFYKLCKLDNQYIFDFLGEEQVSIPPMSISQLDHILHKRMKLGKSCDIYHLTVEHLRYCGDEGKLQILGLINRILKDIYFLTCPQIKLGLGTALHKGKKKPITMSRSYRRITVTPQLGAIIDYYIDPAAESIFRKVQSPDQLGFTAGYSYLMAAIQRGECQRWAIDTKQTCFGVSLDGEAAFPSVVRDIQVRELYSVGERDGLLSYSKNTYTNTECHLKQDGKLSRKISEYKGNRQGHVRASGHFKTYINPCLCSLSDSNLGFWIGPLCITSVCVADDTYVLSSSPSSLQGALNIVSHYGKRYQLNFNADKTKIVVTGSKVDMQYFQDISPWTLNGERVSVVEDNEHLGLIVSGLSEEQKNVDSNIQQCRNSLFGLLGPAYSYKCLLSPVVQIHLWRTYNLPILISGLQALPLRPPNMKAAEIFQNKTLRGFLKLSSTSPIPALYFLLGELPVEGKVHIATLTLFHTIWASPDTTVHKMLKYILMMCQTNSTTWSNHVRLLAWKYALPDPLQLLNSPAWPKSIWKTHVTTKVIVFYENELRGKSLSNSKMLYLNVQLLGLNGRVHPALLNINTTQDSRKLRPHLKFLSGDFLSGEMLAADRPSLSPACKLCSAPVDSYDHILLACRATAETRERIFPELLNIVSQVQPRSILLQNHSHPQLTQFILDCTSPNLDENLRIPAHNPGISHVYKISRDWTFAISNQRTRLLKKVLDRK